MTHICKGCAIDKPSEAYRVHKRGYRIGKCRECERMYQREWSSRNPDLYRKRKRESMARRRAADIDAAREYGRSYHQKNRERRTEKMREYARRRFFWNREMHLRSDNRAT